MNLDEDKIDDAVLALLFLSLGRDGRAWKSFDWDAMGRLHEKGMIGDATRSPRRSRASTTTSTARTPRRC